MQCVLQDSPNSVLYLRACVCVQLCVLGWQPEAKVSFTWSLSPLYLLPAVIMDLKGRLKRTGLSGSVAL